MQLVGRRYDTGQAVCLETAQDRISRITPNGVNGDPAKRWPWIAPGFFDIQINGYGGQELASANDR